MVAVLFNAGDQVPVMPFNEVVGKGASVAPEHIGATGLKIGVLLVPAVPTVILNVVLQFLVSLTVTV